MNKLRYPILFAGLLASAAFVQAQISGFEVFSDSGPGNDLQIAGLYTSAPAMLQVQSPSANPGYHNLNWVVSNYYTVQANTPGSVLSPSPYVTWYNTKVTNVAATGYGTNLIVNCSGRFRIEPGYWSWEWVEDLYGWGSGGYDWVYHEGTTGVLKFVVGAGSNFSLQVMGPGLSAYGLTGLESPYVTVYGPSGYITSASGDGNTSLGYLNPGTYYVYAGAADDTNAGLVTVSINKQ